MSVSVLDGIRLVEERGLRERLAGLDVADGGRAAVAQKLEDLETTLGEQVEGVGRVSLQEQGLVRGQAARLGDAGEALELVLVEVREQRAGAEVGERAVVGAHGRVYRAVGPAGRGPRAQPGAGAPPAAMSAVVGSTTIADGPSSGHLYSQMPQPMQRLGDHGGPGEVVLRRRRGA